MTTNDHEPRGSVEPASFADTTAGTAESTPYDEQVAAGSKVNIPSGAAPAPV